jgi:hypothetical protein
MKAIIFNGQVLGFAASATQSGGRVDTPTMSYDSGDASKIQIVDGLTPPADFVPGLYSWNGTTLARGTDSAAALSAAKAAAKVTLAANRYAAETGGTTFNGVAIRTDEASQAKVSGAFNLAQINPSMVFQWKTASGAWVQLSATQITALGNAVGAHVQGCYTNEQTICALIDAATSLPAVNAINLNSGWPI